MNQCIVSLRVSKVKLNAVVSALLLVVFGCSPLSSPFANGAPIPNPYSANGEASFLLPAERAWMNEINYARTKPKEYAEEYVKPLFKKCSHPSKEEQLNKYVKTLYDYLYNIEPREPLIPVLGLTLSVRDFIADPLRSNHGSGNPKTGAYYGGGAGWSGENGWFKTHPVEDYQDPNYASNINGDCYATNPVLGWLIDGGVPSYGHRLILMESRAKFIGIAMGNSTATSGPLVGKGAVVMQVANESYADKIAGDFKNGSILNRHSIAKVVTWETYRF